MEASELRIGNKVYLDDLDIETGKWHQRIQDISYRDIYNLMNGDDMVKDAYQPIPLTEEWLLRLGFEGDFNCYPINNGLIEVYYSASVVVLNIEGQRIALPYINHIHRLQNLYFALTGEELTWEQ